MTEIDEAIQTLCVMQSQYSHIRHRETEWAAVEQAIAALREKQEREQNEPLTLEILCLPQLRQMEGERVTVMRMGVMTQAEPAIVKKDGHCVSDSGCLCYAELYGETWVAYRRPPEQ